MKKTIAVLSSALLLGGLAACNNDDNEALNERYDYNAREIGYYSNENNRDGNRNGTAGYGGDEAVRDNDGPITELLDGNDHNGNNNGTRNTTNNRNNGPDNGFSRADYNYSGQRDDLNERADSSYYNQYEGDLAERISRKVAKVDQVDDARTVIYNDDILIAVDTNDRNDKNVEKQVKQAVGDLARGKDVRVVTDENTFNRVEQIDNDLRNGNAMDEIQSDIKGIFNDLGDAVQRPFQDNK